jgi:diguanylate cyclase (GGDEF)-like protein
MTASPHKPQKVGVIVDGLGNYQRNVLAGMRTVALEAGVNIVVYVGRELNPVLAQNRPANELYGMIDSSLAGLIIFSGGVGHYLNNDELEVFVSRFMPERMVSLTRVIQGVTSVLIDNEPGMNALMEHLIVARGFRKFAYMRGVLQNPESQQRERIFNAALERYGIPIPSEHFLQGNFSRAPAYQATLAFLDSGPDVEVIVAANDDMAYGIQRAAQARGLRVPEDLAVTGFDNDELSIFLTPALTTVHQPLLEYGHQAMRAMLRLLAGEPGGNVFMPSELIVRESCNRPASRQSNPDQLNSGQLNSGQSNPGQTGSPQQQSELFSSLLQHADKRFNEQYEFHNLHLLETSLMAVNSLPELLAHLPSYLLALGVQQAYVLLYPQPALQPASSVKLAFAFRDGSRQPEVEGLEFETFRLLPEHLQNAMNGMMLVQPLFVGETHYGLFLTDANNGTRLYHEPLNALLSGSIHNVYQTTALRAQTASLEERIVERTRALEQTNAQLHAEIQQRHTAEIALRQANATLRQIASLDGLTGLYNRAAFDDFLEQHWQQHAQDQLQLSLILIDIDSFKKYNDHYGHVPGDECLRAVANVLKACVQRANDMVARYGGEEFAIVLTDTAQAGSEIVIARVQDAIRQLAIPHERSDVAPTLTVSIGISTCIPDANQPEVNLIASADRALYEAKQNGRNQHRRHALEQDSNLMTSSTEPR